MDQLELFMCGVQVLESKALLLVELDSEILALEQEKKDLQKQIKEQDLNCVLADVMQQLKDAKERRAVASQELLSLKKVEQ